MRLVLSVLLLAACARSEGPSFAPDAGSAGEVGPCNDPALWTRAVASSRREALSDGCGTTNLFGTGFSVPASAACFRVTRAGPVTGWEGGETWRGESDLPIDAPASVRTGFFVRIGAGPLEVSARYRVEGELHETVATLEAPRRTPLVEGVEAFVGLGVMRGSAGGTPWRIAVVTETQAISPEGVARTLSGRALDAAAWPPWTVALVETPAGMLLEAFSERDAGDVRRVPLGVSPEARFAPASARALVDRAAGEVVFLDAETFEETARARLPAGAAADLVVSQFPPEVHARVGDEVWSSTPGEPPRRLTRVPGLEQLVAHGDSTRGSVTTLLAGNRYGFLGPTLSGREWTPNGTLATSLETPALATTATSFVTAEGFTWRPWRGGELGPERDDTRRVDGGAIVDFDLRAAAISIFDLSEVGAYAVRRADGLVDAYRWSEGKCAINR